MTERFVVLGDGIAGATAAKTLREKRPDAKVTVITDETEPLYNRILIKEFAKGKLVEEKVKIHDLEWYKARNIDLRLNTRAVEVREKDHEVVLATGEALPYDKVLVALGGTPKRLSIPGA
ncbi:MAG: FAD-dependent oxidoreductase, partial [Methanobacteriota archaeon]